MSELFIVEKDRFDLADKSIYYVYGGWPRKHKVKVLLDKTEISAEIKRQDSTDLMESTRNLDSSNSVKIQIKIQLPENLSSYKKMKIYAEEAGASLLWFSVSVKKLLLRQAKPQYFIEDVNVDFKPGMCQIRGWGAFCQPLDIYLTDSHHKKIPCTVQRFNRMDVKKQFFEVELDDKCGFFVEFPHRKYNEVHVVFQAEGVRTIRLIHLQPLLRKVEKLENYVGKGTQYLKMHGVKALYEKVLGKNKPRVRSVPSYQDWIMKHLPSKEEIKRQKRVHFSWNPKFSVVVPLYKTPEKYLRILVESLQKQTYSNWELCLSDGSGANSPIRELLVALQKEDKRIRVVSHDTALRISENTNAAIEMATGDFIVFADHDDELTVNALFECAKAINEKTDLEVIYSDEDKITGDGRQFFHPHFKPDFNIDLLCTVNYICHLFVAKKDLIDRVGMLRKEFDGAQDYDFIFRCVEAAGREKIHHIPKILYHWRCHEESTSENPESKLYAFDAGQRAIEAHYKRIGVPVEISKGEFLGLYRTKFLRETDPLISIMIPNKDHIDDLKRCMDSIESKSTYKNYEYIIIENNSTEPETFEYYKQLELSNPKVHVVYWDGPFNYSAINNFGVKFAKGEYLLLLNNDTEIINEDCLEELLGYCTREDVGAVGARLYYPDDTIQHAGVVIGFGGIAGHCFVQQPRGFTGYCHRIICAQDYSAVTAACMMVKRSAFETVNGLSEKFQVAFNDIDFCLRLREANYLIVYNPYAELYHYESKSRGLDNTPEKIVRFQREIATFEERWADILRDGDPLYNPNLTLESQDFSLKRS